MNLYLIPAPGTSPLANGKAICAVRAPVHWLGDCFAAHGRANDTQLEVLTSPVAYSAHYVDDGAVYGLDGSLDGSLEGLMSRDLPFTIGSCVPMSTLSLTRCLDSLPACGRRSARVWLWGFQTLTDRAAVLGPTGASALRRRVVRLVRRATIQVG